MNLANALVFAVLGWVLEMLPKAFPSWFPHTGSDVANSRALWLGLMGGVQMAVGLGFILRTYGVPAFQRLVSLVPSGEATPLSLPGARGVHSGRP